MKENNNNNKNNKIIINIQNTLIDNFEGKTINEIIKNKNINLNKFYDNITNIFIFPNNIDINSFLIYLKFISNSNNNNNSNDIKKILELSLIFNDTQTINKLLYEEKFIEITKENVLKILNEFKNFINFDEFKSFYNEKILNCLDNNIDYI